MNTRMKPTRQRTFYIFWINTMYLNVFTSCRSAGFPDSSLWNGTLNGDPEVASGDVIAVIWSHLLANHGTRRRRRSRVPVDEPLHQRLPVEALHKVNRHHVMLSWMEEWSKRGGEVDSFFFFFFIFSLRTRGICLSVCTFRSRPLKKDLGPSDPDSSLQLFQTLCQSFRG